MMNRAMSSNVEKISKCWEWDWERTYLQNKIRILRSWICRHRILTDGSLCLEELLFGQ